MKKVYIIPAVRIVKAHKECFITTSGKGTGDAYSKDVSNFEYNANEDDFWSTSK